VNSRAGTSLLEADHAETPPSPEVLFSQERLEAHARAIAGTHTLAPPSARSRPLLPRLDDSARELEEAYQFLSATARDDPQPVASEDWLRDNYHVVQDQVREVREDLPRKYYRELPKLAAPPFDGFPRVYPIARELITHTAGRLDLETLIDFVNAYQQVAQLSIGEIWAIPIMLRLALVEELRRLAAGVVAVRRNREQARAWQRKVAKGANAAHLIDVLLRAQVQAEGRLSAAFVVELLQWLRDQPPSAGPVWLALQQALDAQDDSAEELLRVEHQREATDQLAMGNVIASMRLLSAVDWPHFFDRVSLVEQTLRDDPAGAYAAMDFHTRDRYRHSVEQLARRSKHSERAVAERAVSFARAAMAAHPDNDRRHHVGYYLISRGRLRLEEELRSSPSASELLARFFFRHPVIGYLGTISVATALGVANLLAYAARRGATTGELWVVGLLALIPVSELAISLVNSLLTAQIAPRPLPKLDMRDGIPAHSRTIVVVPAIVDSESRLESLLHDLEVRFLANRDANLHFALLSDFPDAAEAELAGEDALLATARRRVEALNERHGANRFYFLHRARRWNPGEGRWMGWERKRGKLAELNRLLRGATDTSFVLRSNDVSILRSIKYVITLDSDTQLPMETARRLVGTLAHPLNRPRFDPHRGRVTEGYGVLQPRIEVNVESANRTSFAQVFAGHVGLDPYTTAVSDVYQDLFHEGSYVGKGIYDIDAFSAALDGRVPPNTLLSHDLFEGMYARTGLCTDIHLVDDYPTNYLAFAARQHRWVRGDWQIVRWLWRTVPDESGRAVPNTLPVIARWKILDNLRRSMLAPALVALFLAGWTVLPGSVLAWSGVALLVLAFPAYMQVGRSLWNRIHGVPLREHILAERANLETSVRQALLSAVFLLHQSFVMVDAIVRTMIRVVVTRRHLLEWVTSDRSVHVPASTSEVFRQMPATPIAAVAMTVLVAVVAPMRLTVALPVLALWCLSPALAYATGRPLWRHLRRLRAADRATLGKLARRTWRFFDDFVGRDDHWLVPDNIQENRRELIAHRTSPTNIGLQLLATIAAYDHGYLSIGGVLDRLDPTFATLLRLQRYRGHLYNWYDTKTLAPLRPGYISTVDSGNFAGYLLTLRAGLVGITEQTPIIGVSFLEGLEDLVNLFDDEMARELADGKAAAGAGRTLKKDLAALRQRLKERPTTLAQWKVLLSQIHDGVSGLGVLLLDLEEPLLAASGGTAAATPTVTEAGYWLERLASTVRERQHELDRLVPFAEDATEAGVPTLTALLAVEESRQPASELLDRAERLAALADDCIEETEFDFLFNEERQLFSIGFNVTDGRLDPSYYDTLASEARLASFVAIATGKISHEHWFKLGRSLTPAGTSRALLSWSASMFEYLMPLLVMRAYPGTLLAETHSAVVRQQIQYGARRAVPWGISESAYNAQDLDGNYQYRAFGVPGLGLKRGLADDLVVAPYASLLAAPLEPEAVVSNLAHLRSEGMAGRYGYYEAIDYTADRLPPGTTGGVVLSTYMAHHQGMILLAVDNALHDSPMQHRFHADPRVQAAELLLHERIPHLVPLKNPPIEKADHVPSTRRLQPPAVRRYVTPHTLSPRTHLLSNGSYGVMVTNAGGGYSRRQDLALTRWREDLTTDAWGSFCYVRDLDTGDVWSTTYQPTLREPDEYEVTFAPDRAVWRRVDRDIEVRSELVVSPEDDAELRRVSLTNHGTRVRNLELTSYAEVVLAQGNADLAHPVFSNLFIESIAVPERDALMCVRRPRGAGEHLYLIHVLSGRGQLGGATEYETDRARFVGRGRTLERPAALDGKHRLSKTTGPVLDPIISLRQSVRIPPGVTARLAFTTAFAATEEAARQLIEKYHDRRAVARALALASTHSQIELRHMGLTIEETMRFQRLAGRLLYGDPRLRVRAAVEANLRGQSALWKYGISGDLPILLVQVSDHLEIALFRELLKAHEYLRLKGFAFDLVVLNDHAASYLQDLQHALMQLVESGPEQAWQDRPGGVFLRRSDLMPLEDQQLLRAVARVVMTGTDGGLAEQLKRPHIPFEPPRSSSASARPRPLPSIGSVAPTPPPDEVTWFNGVGGFVDGGREYLIRVHQQAGVIPPRPWTNVVAHSTFGFAATECGPGFTWSINSHDNRLTPWRNDPVSDQPGEAVFVRDETTGRFWSLTPLPAGDGLPYTIRHGQGYTSFEHEREGIASTLLLFVPPDDEVKVFRITLRNTSEQPRTLSVTLYAEWVLGENRTRSALHVVTSCDKTTGALLGENRFRPELASRVAFLDLSPGNQRSFTGDRTEFVGRNGTLGRPESAYRPALSNRTGGAFDPCGAIRVSVTLGPSEERTLVGLLGDAADADRARALVERYRDLKVVDDGLRRSRGFWDQILGTLVVRTPDPAMDLMINRWLLYQTLGCRIWGRSAFYQSSGAFGFRDQLQDVLALLPSAPAIARAHLLRAASRQFVEGDVQHWWHEPGGQGVRTRFSDDRVWLAYATLAYVGATGDATVLDEQLPFLEGRRLHPDEHEAYEIPTVSQEKAPLYDHCVRALALNLETGAHGLPLMGTGDWNDGMNLVGAGGQGESVWLAWFLLCVLRPFADLAAARGDHERATQYRQHSERLAEAAEAAWDGAWYRRAYFDDGTPLGSQSNDECRIDALAQSWAVMADANPERARQAMASTNEHLVREDDRLVLLLTPPFDRMRPSPGYIEGYLPGVRENGGQYTHAALWTVLAFARLGDGDRAMELFTMLNPVTHTLTPEGVGKYRAEPYVVAADVYSRPPHNGRGGWTWYTGSAGWMYRVGVESLLGLTLKDGALRIDPCLPRHWKGYRAVFRVNQAEFHIVVENPDGVNRGVRTLEVDGRAQQNLVSIRDAVGQHHVRVILG
jgi:cyclic beta-1,2-glucan synthetase